MLLNIGSQLRGRPLFLDEQVLPGRLYACSHIVIPEGTFSVNAILYVPDEKNRNGFLVGTSVCGDLVGLIDKTNCLTWTSETTVTCTLSSKKKVTFHILAESNRMSSVHGQIISVIRCLQLKEFLQLEKLHE